MSLKFKDLQFVVCLSNNISFDDKHIDVLATIENKDALIIDEDTLLTEVNLDVFSSDTLFNPSDENHRAALHAMLDAFLDRAEKERAE